MVIQLGVVCANDPLRALWQLAHECVHLLSPTGGFHSTTLEEGLATIFSEEYFRPWGPTQYEWAKSGATAAYRMAANAAGELLALDASCIRTIREEQPRFDLMDAELILRHVPTCERVLAKKLTCPWKLVGSDGSLPQEYISESE